MSTTGLHCGVLLSEGVNPEASVMEFSLECIQLLKLFVGVTEDRAEVTPSLETSVDCSDGSSH